MSEVPPLWLRFHSSIAGSSSQNERVGFTHSFAITYSLSWTKIYYHISPLDARGSFCGIHEFPDESTVILKIHALKSVIQHMSLYLLLCERDVHATLLRICYKTLVILRFPSVSSLFKVISLEKCSFLMRFLRVLFQHCMNLRIFSEWRSVQLPLLVFHSSQSKSFHNDSLSSIGTTKSHCSLMFNPLK